MAFWGIEVEPGKPYVHQYDDQKGTLRVSQATVAVDGSSNKRSVLQCAVGDKKPTYLCSLLPKKIETCALNLEFEEEDEVTFSVQGPHSVHLSGFFFGREEEHEHDNCCDEYDSDSYGEDVMVSGSEDDDDSMEYDSEDEEDDEFSEDDLVPNRGVKIEEIVEEEKPDNEIDMSKQAKKKKKRNQLDTSDENENSNRQVVAKDPTCVAVLESEDEDGFPKSSHSKKSDVSNPGPKSDVAEKDRSGLKNKENNTSEEKKLKRKIDAVTQDGEPTSDITTPVNEVKEKKKNKKKKLEKEESAQQSGAPKSKSVGASPPVATKDLTKTADKKKEKKKQNKQLESVTPKTEEKVADRKGSEKKEKVRTYPNGLMIEDLVMGKPDGKRASPGQKVSVRYIGKLQKNGKIFDSNVGGPPFKFRLGIGQVIKGWDVGVNGMRIGDKRRLTIPPAMGYGSKGAGPDIPPNAWLVFDVELVAVN